MIRLQLPRYELFRNSAQRWYLVRKASPDSLLDYWKLLTYGEDSCAAMNLAQICIFELSSEQYFST